MANVGGVIIKMATSTTSTQNVVVSEIISFKIKKVLNLGVDYFDGVFKSPMSITPTVGMMLVVTMPIRGTTITEYIGEVYDVTYENRNTRIKARTYSYKLCICNDSFASATDPGNMMDKAVAKSGLTKSTTLTWSQAYDIAPMYDVQCALIALKRATEYPTTTDGEPTCFYPTPGTVASITIAASGADTPSSGVTLTYANGLVESPSFTTRGDSVVDYVVVNGLEAGIASTTGTPSGRSEVLYRQEYASNADCAQIGHVLYDRYTVNRTRVNAKVKFSSLFPSTVTDIDTPMNKKYTIVDSIQNITQVSGLSQYSLDYPTLMATCVFESPFIDYNDFVPEIDTRVSQLERTPSGGTSKIFIQPSTTERMTSEYRATYTTANATYVQAPYGTVTPTSIVSMGVGDYTVNFEVAKNVQNGSVVVRRYSSAGVLMQESAANTITSTAWVVKTVTMTDINLGDTISLWVKSTTGTADFFWASSMHVMYDYKPI